jgi:hypothetical protein
LKSPRSYASTAARQQLAEAGADQADRQVLRLVGHARKRRQHRPPRTATVPRRISAYRTDETGWRTPIDAELASRTSVWLSPASCEITRSISSKLALRPGATSSVSACRA